MKLRSVAKISGISALGVSLCASLLFGSVFAAVIAGRAGNAVLPAECGVVFGAAVTALRDDRGRVVAEVAGPGIARRVDTAVNLWKNRQIERIFLSGGKGEGMTRSEAEVMLERALKQGIPRNVLVGEDTSKSTEENLQNVAMLTKDCRSIVAISDGYHLTRIRLLAWQQGMHLTTYPAQRQPDRAFELSSLLRETCGVIYYASRGLLQG